MSEASTVYVALDSDSMRCLRHGEMFAKTGTCKGCLADPGSPPTAKREIAKPPAGCMTTVQIERWNVQQARELTQLRRKLTAPPKRRKVATGEAAPKAEAVLDTHAFNAAAKLADTAAKYMRAAAELAARREDEETVARREREAKQFGGHH